MIVALDCSQQTAIEESVGVGNWLNGQTNRTGLRDNESTMGVTRRVTSYSYTQMFEIGTDTTC